MCADSQCHNVTTNTALGTSACVPCSTFNHQRPIVCSNPLVSSVESTVGHIPPPLMFQKPGELYVPHLPPSSMAPVHYIPHSCAYQDLRIQCSSFPNESCQMCNQCSQSPVLISTNNRREVSPGVVRETAQSNITYNFAHNVGSPSSIFKEGNVRLEVPLNHRTKESKDICIGSENESLTRAAIVEPPEHESCDEHLLEDESLTESRV